MTKLAEKAVVFATLVVLAAMAYGLLAAARWVVLGVFGLDEKLAAAIIAACATVLVSVGTVVYTQRKTSAREIENSHRKEKAEVYKRFMEKVVLGFLKATKDDRLNKEEFQKELQDVYIAFTGELIVWGSPAVVLAFRTFRSGQTGVEVIYRMDDLLQAMRKDLGNSNRGLTRGELFKLFLKDPENLDSPPPAVENS